jgi:hypothetical protein
LHVTAVQVASEIKDCSDTEIVSDREKEGMWVMRRKMKY